MSTSIETPAAPSTPRRPGRRALAIGVTSALVAVAAVNGVWQAVGATDAREPGPSEIIQERLDGLVDLGFPAALASWTSPDGDHGDYVAGADLATGDPVPVDGEVRVGSNSKTYTAVVVLQLVEEGLVDLDASVEQYLPGLVRGEGVDASAITVRHLLQHTSGLPEYTDAIAPDIADLQHSYTSPRDLLDAALAEPALFAPGTGWAYSNTGYLLLGLIVERVTERPLYEQVTERIIEPLGLERTYFPVPGEQQLRGEHPRGYHGEVDGEPFDVSVLDPSWGWAAGQVVAPPSELNEFFRAVLDGRLLGEQMIAEMTTAVPMGEEELVPGSEYGLGLQSTPLSCGGLIWGHGGDIHGYQTRNGVTADGTAFSVAVTSLPWGFLDPEDEEPLLDAYRAVTDAVDAALCADV